MKTPVILLTIAAAWVAAEIPAAIAAEATPPPVQNTPPATEAVWPRIRALIENNADSAEWTALQDELWSAMRHGDKSEERAFRFLNLMLQHEQLDDPHLQLMASLATEYGDVEYFLARGAKKTLNEVRPDSYHQKHSPLFMAAGHHTFGECDGNDYYPYISRTGKYYAKAVKLLLEAGADPNTAKGPRGMTPLMAAAYAGNEEGVWSLLQSGANVAARDADGGTALSWAVQGGNPDCVFWLIKQGAEVNGILCQGPHLSRPLPLLHAAVATLEPTIVSYLLEAGADPQVKDSDGDPPLSAINNKALRSYGARSSMSEEEIAKRQEAIRTLLSEENLKANRQTRFLDALNRESREIDTFFAQGANPNGVIIGAYGECMTPLFYAAAKHQFGECEGKYGHSNCTATEYNTRMIRRLLEIGADPNLPSGRYLLRTPLMVAAASGSLENVKLLVEAGARVNQATTDGLTALSYALSGGYVDIARYLISKGAEVNVLADDTHGSPYFRSTLLHQAANACQPEVVKMLLAAGADPAAQDKFGSTPLHWLAMRPENPHHLCYKTASPEEQGRTAQVFFDATRHPQPVNTDALAARPQLTPLMKAAYAGDIPALKKLLAEGANVNEKNEDGATALSWAVAGGRVDAAHHLIHCGAKLDVPATDMYYRAQALRFTLLHAAALQQREDMVLLLLDTLGDAAPAALKATDAYGLTPGAWLFNCKSWDIVPAGAPLRLPYVSQNQLGNLEKASYKRLQEILPSNIPAPASHH